MKPARKPLKWSILGVIACSIVTFGSIGLSLLTGDFRLPPQDCNESDAIRLRGVVRDSVNLQPIVGAELTARAVFFDDWWCADPLYMERQFVTDSDGRFNEWIGGFGIWLTGITITAPGCRPYEYSPHILEEGEEIQIELVCEEDPTLGAAGAGLKKLFHRQAAKDAKILE